MRKCSILDLFIITEHLKKYIDQPNLIMRVRGLFMNPRFSFYTDEGMVIVSEELENLPGVVRVHPYIDKEYRGKMFIKALKGLQELVETQHLYRTLRIEFREGDRQTKMLLGCFKEKAVKKDDTTYEYDFQWR